MTRAPVPDRALAEGLLALRTERGLSREALAFRSRTAPRTLAQIEDARIIPRWDTVRRLARGLDVSLAQLGEAIERSEAAIGAGTLEGPVV